VYPFMTELTLCLGGILAALGARDGSACRLLGHKDQIHAVAFSPDGAFLVSGGWEEKLIVWHLGKQPRREEVKTGSPIESIAVSPDGAKIAYGVLSTEIVLYDVTNKTEIRRPTRETLYPFGALDFSRSGERIAAGSGSMLFLWDLKKRSIISRAAAHGKVREVRYSADGKLLASAGVDPKGGTVKLWEAADDFRELRTLRGHQGGVFGLCFLGKSRALVSAGEDKTIVFWDADTGKKLHVIDGAHDELIADLAATRDGSVVFSASHDHTVKAWDTKTYRRLATFRGHTNGLITLAVSPDQRRLASAGFDWDVRLWDITSVGK
jgi:WD40 repeat protein